MYYYSVTMDLIMYIYLMGEIKYIKKVSNTLRVSTLSLLNKQNNTIMNELQIIIESVNELSLALNININPLNF